MPSTCGAPGGKAVLRAWGATDTYCTRYPAKAWIERKLLSEFATLIAPPLLPVNDWFLLLL